MNSTPTALEDRMAASLTLPPIDVRGARTHNLKAVNFQIPRGRLTVVTGVSGSGKSSLAFDTLYAEGQRRYVEALSTYARQFLERLPRPPVDSISHLPPAIALEQKNHVKNARSTVGTATEIHDFLRLLFARVATRWCPDCNKTVQRDSPQSVLAQLKSNLPADARLTLSAPVPIEKPANFDATRRELIAAGFYRVVTPDGIAELDAWVPPRRNKSFTVDILVDRLTLSPENRDRLSQALAQSFKLSRGFASVHVLGETSPRLFAEGRVCSACRRVFRSAEPPLFSFYSPRGACHECQGFGRTITIDYDKVLPNPDLTLSEGAIHLFTLPSYRKRLRYLIRFSSRRDLPLEVPLRNFTPRQRDILINGKDDWCGLQGFFKYMERKKYKVQNRVLLARYRGFVPCPDCGGARLCSEALAFRLGDLNIAQLGALSIEQLRPWLLQLEPQLSRHDLETARRILDEIHTRLRFLEDVGLGYLRLDRATRTLSNGEAQRINLASVLGSGLTDTLYILDEPTVGLHSRDTDRLLRLLQALCRIGNTVVVVEHDLEVIRGADHLLDLGPAAGEHGGTIIFEGALAALLKTDSATARALRNELDFSDGVSREKFINAKPRTPSGWLHLRGAAEHNLKNLDVAFPLGVMACVTGVSGSGKSTLVRDLLFGEYQRKTGNAVEPACHSGLDGLNRIQECFLIDQSPPGRSTRSNPVTYTKAYDEIRKLLASTPQARARGIPPGAFSFNVPGGRCEKCEGSGVVTVDMHFLADVEVTCEGCDGQRFQQKILDLHWRGKNVVEILDLTVNEAIAFFGDYPRIARLLQPLRDVGLGYLRLGQPTATLSGGEAQRLKLASYLRPRTRKSSKTTLLLFDEPTTGLHAADLATLLGCFQRLVNGGYSLLIIEHNLDLIARADYILDLGPEGGDQGGELLFAGPPASLLNHRTSHTALYLRKRLDHLSCKN
ncbi:MAG: excinuclease ABC subunit UvrA [bacterium]